MPNVTSRSLRRIPSMIETLHAYSLGLLVMRDVAPCRDAFLNADLPIQIWVSWGAPPGHAESCWRHIVKQTMYTPKKYFMSLYSSMFEPCVYIYGFAAWLTWQSQCELGSGTTRSGACGEKENHPKNISWTSHCLLDDFFCSIKSLASWTIEIYLLDNPSTYVFPSICWHHPLSNDMPGPGPTAKALAVNVANGARCPRNDWILRPSKLMRIC